MVDQLNIGDMVTILNGTTPYEVTEIREGMARVWPTNEDDPREGQWIAPGLLQKHCRYCGRPIFHGGRPQGWNLVYREYADTTKCDARSDGSTLSQEPHVPVGRYVPTAEEARRQIGLCMDYAGELDMVARAVAEARRRSLDGAKSTTHTAAINADYDQLQAAVAELTKS